VEGEVVELVPSLTGGWTGFVTGFPIVVPDPVSTPVTGCLFCAGSIIDVPCEGCVPVDGAVEGEVVRLAPSLTGG
jgi:hypothetical protein